MLRRAREVFASWESCNSEDPFGEMAVTASYLFALFALTLAAGMESDAESILQKKHMSALKRVKEANEYAKRPIM